MLMKISLKVLPPSTMIYSYWLDAFLKNKRKLSEVMCPICRGRFNARQKMQAAAVRDNVLLDHIGRTFHVRQNIDQAMRRRQIKHARHVLAGLQI